MQAIAVDVRTKIPAGYKDEKFNRINKGYVNFATAGNKQKRKSTKIWQQMPGNSFFNLLSKKQLYFKQFSVYDSRDERQLKFYENNYFLDDQYEQKMIDDFAKTAYISCWYQSDNLTDIVFKEYAKGSVGVAIGTTVELLLKTLNRKICKPSGNGIKNELFYGDTVYLGDQRCKNLKLSDPADLISPLFIKSENHNDDREFRLACVMNSVYCDNGRFSESKQKEMGDNILLQANPNKWMQIVAVRNDDRCTLDLTKYLLSKFLNKNSLTMTSGVMDGFTILHLERK